MKTHCTILATALAAALSASAKTFDWPIDAPTAGARQFTAYHGETVRFNLLFRGAMTNLSPRAIYYQTNGMGRAEWFGPVPGTVFHPTNDCGAAFYRFFIRCADPDGVDYTANGSLRLLDSPGFDPSTVQLPVQTLDFSKIEVLNPPWGEGGVGSLEPATNYTDGVASLLQGDIARKASYYKYEGGATSNVLVSCDWWMSSSYTLRERADLGEDTWRFAAGELRPPRFGGPTYELTYRAGVGWVLEYGSASQGMSFVTNNQDRAASTLTFDGGFTLVRTNEVWAAGTNRYPVVYADDLDAAIQAAGGVTPEMVTNIVNDVAPAPGDYAAVSNAAMTAVQPGDLSAVRTVADAAATTNAAQATALSQISQRTNDWDAAVQNASDALSYSRATYDFQQGNTNAWFSGTNYVFGADAANKTAFAFEPGMDLMAMPCSLALMEIRDGITQKVWDSRDWTAWYWNFKNAQYEATVAERLSAAAAFNATNYAPIAWGRRTSSGRANPDPKTLWVDAEKTVLAPGMAWESTVEVSGCTYWTIVGSATLSGTTNGVITIKDFEGKPVFSIKKTSSRLVYLECGSEIYTHGSDSQGRITFTMRSSVQPVGEFSTVLDDSLFVSEDDAGCPVDYEWETVSAGVYRCHFLLKPGILSDACFAKFKVEIQGETAVEFSAPQKITGGIIYNDGVHGDVKIRPVITSTAVGSVVTWEVAP